jgi:hypothetical protein
MYTVSAAHRMVDIGGTLNGYNNPGHDSAVSEMFEPEEDGNGPPT